MENLVNIEKQNLVTEFFNQSLTKNHLARSYLLTGRALKDKLELIKQINLVLNCQLNNNSVQFISPCMQCQNCRWIAVDTHPRTPLLLKPQEDEKKNNDEEDKVRRKQIIKMEQSLELLAELSQSSEYFRIVIIEDASLKTLKPDSATVLLKTIEEAKPNTMFMLLSESKDAVLSTLVSRSQVIHFNNTETTKEYQEAAQELYTDLTQWLEAGSAGSQLEQVIKAEKLAETEDIHLIEMLSLLQNEYSYNSDLNSAKLVLELETAINDIRSFVRKKAVLAPLLKQLA